MATEPDHIAVANRNQQTINYLCADINTHAPWIATVAFYKALHIVEAVFANDPAIKHTSDHPSRFRTLKQTASYQTIYRHYSKLFRVSSVARYLEDQSRASISCFDEYMKPDKVAAFVLFHLLKQVETSARSRLANPSALESVDVAKNALGMR